jgi:outer membrane protein assembly factor BamB
MPEPLRISIPPGILGALALAFALAVAPRAAAQTATAQTAAAQTATAQTAAAQAPAKPGSEIFPLTSVWMVKLDTPPALSAAYDAARAYIVLKPDPDRAIPATRLTAVSLSNGSTKWTREINAADSIVADGDHLVASAGSLLQAFATSDGTPRWQLALSAPLSAPLLPIGGWLIAVTQASDAVAVRSLDGAKLWQVHLPSPAVGKPAAAGDALYLPLTDNRVLRLKLDTGGVVWDEKILSQPTTLLALDDRVFVGTSGWFYALQPKDGKVLWRFRVGGAVVGEPAASVSAVYFLALDDLLRALDRESGPLKWRQILVRRERFGPLRVADLLFVSGNSPTIQAYDMKSGTPAGSFDAPHDLKMIPVHLVPGLLERDFLLMAMTGEGELMAIRPQSLQPEAFAVSPRAYLLTGFPIWRW